MNAKTKVLAPSLLSISLLHSFTLLAAVVPLLFFTTFSYAQETEFPKNKDGLIYSEQTMAKLKTIVDSLNLKFRTCELSKNYLAKNQAIGHSILIEKGNLKEAAKDLENQISFADFKKKYPKAVIEKDQLVIKYNYEEEEKPVVAFRSVSIGESGGNYLEFTKDPEKFTKPLKGKWIFNYEPKESLRAFYLVEEFQAKPLPMAYARQVQYSNCMVDTTTTLFSPKALKSGRRSSSRESEKVNAFLEYVHKETNQPVYQEEEYEKYSEQMEKWAEARYTRLDNLNQTAPDFQKRLTEATTDALKHGGSQGEFEEYVHRYLSPKTALELKRSYRVVGGCSQDDSPRRHARSIAELAAETTNWEIFLRSHLDLMNDNFSRVSDGSYAWARRQTYIGELEALDINVTDLLMGISLQIENPAKNHYYGHISRVGRALTESKDAKALETKMLQMIADPELDLYNRIAIYYLFRNYNGHLENKAAQKKNIERLNTTVRSFPPSLAAQAVVKYEE